ncbi:hypothetical protein P43SY_005716 [Pythium insidiosum]|uniref:Homologous recombination OB-fold protein OB-fold domain-containing protein n=1 Tax=Pythium insidiosum TaxID=114742 RepID=A0AAD5M9P3_PYTIN|nr:hypothetical protein P43SY_005716 [Pythium insidiosum]
MSDGDGDDDAWDDEFPDDDYFRVHVASASASDESAAVGVGAEAASDAVVSPSRAGDRKRPRPSPVVEQRQHLDDRNDDDDFESQPTLLKWVRHVPGPLHDVMKKQAADLHATPDDVGEYASGRSTSHGVNISTVFDDGPWVDMCEYLNMATTRGSLYGGVKMSALKQTIMQIIEEDQTTPKVPRLLALIKSTRYVDEEIVAVLHDPTAAMEGYFHRDIVEHVGPALVVGTAVLLRDVSVFSPTDAGMYCGSSKRYLNIVPRNVERIFVPQSVASNFEGIVKAFNRAQSVTTEAERHKEQVTEAPAGLHDHRLAQADLRSATTELSFISQRQVVQRHQPVIAPATADEQVSGKKKKKAKNDSASGLGRWQWHQLAQRRLANDDELDGDAPRRSQAPTASRFAALLSQHVQARWSANGSEATSKPKANGHRVTFADADVDACSADTSGNHREETAANRGSPRAAKASDTDTVAPHPRHQRHEEAAVDPDDDDDDDW